MREIPIIRALRHRREIAIRLFVHPQHRYLASRSVPEEQTQILTYPAGVSLLYDSELDIDVSKTLRSLGRYVMHGGWLDYRYFRQAVKSRRPVLIVNDFLPVLPLYGRMSRIPVLGIYNYGLRETALGHGLIRGILSRGIEHLYPLMYRMCEEMLVEQIEEGLSKETRFERIPPVARHVTRSAAEVRQTLGADERPLIFLSLGGNKRAPTEQFLETFGPIAERRSWQFLALPRDKEEMKSLKESYPQFLIGSWEWVETQDVVAAMDLVIARAGFTTVAETIKSRVPLLLWHVETHPEIRETENILLAQNLAAGVLYPEDDTMQMERKIEAALNNESLRSRLSTLPADGAEEVAETILRLMTQHSC